MKLRPFEIGLIAFFGIIAIAGIFTISSYQAKSTAKTQPYGEKVVIWGSLGFEEMNSYLDSLKGGVVGFEVVSYKYIDPRNFENEFVNAVAEGRSPDLIVIPHTLLVTLRTKLTPISFDTISQRTFKDSYVDGADIFMRSDGVYGIPFAVDPLVMYWNRDIFSSAGLSEPPKTWENLVSKTTEAITERDANRSITQSAVAFGEYKNVAHAKDTVSMLLLQAGSTIVDERNDTYRVSLRDGLSSTGSVAESVLGFYAQFTIPEKNLYTWNATKSLDLQEFTSGRLGMYFGPGSEWKVIERNNPNLNYDVTTVPQGSGVTTRRTYGDFYAFAIPRASQHAQGGYAVAQLLASPQFAKPLADAFSFAPVHRLLHVVPGNEPFKNVLYQSALIARGWLDPAPQASSVVFREMIEGEGRAQQIVLDTIYKLEALFK